MENNDNLIVVLKAVTHLMGGGWRYNAIDSSSWRHVLQQGRKIIIVKKHTKTQLSLFGYIGNTPFFKQVYRGLSINISIKKKPSLIVQDIKRRLLPELDLILNRAVKDEATAQKFKEDEKIRVDLLSRILPIKSGLYNDKPYYFYFKKAEIIDSDFRAASEGRFSVNKDLSIDLSIRGLTVEDLSSLMMLLKNREG